jgi:hypothetical protein
VDVSQASRPIKAAAALVAAESLALFCLAIAELVAIDRDRLSLGITNAAFFSIYAAGLAFTAWGLASLRRWSRGPIVLAQFIQLGVAYSFAGGDTTWVSIVLGVVAIGVLFVVFAPSTTAALYGIGDESTTQSDKSS